MGEWMIAKTFKFPAWMLARLELEQQRFHPFARTQSETLRLLLQFSFICIDNESLERVLEALQGLHRKTLYAEGMTLLGVADNCRSNTLNSSAEGGEEADLPAAKSRAGVFDCRQTQHPAFLPVHPGLFGFQVPKKVEIGLGGGYARGKRAG